MGAWLELPEVEWYIERRGLRRSMRESGRQRLKYCDIRVQHTGDVANMNDVMDVPLWECEIPLSDDGF